MTLLHDTLAERDKGKLQPSLAAASRMCGWVWGGWLALFPLADLYLRDPRGGLDSYSFELVREVSPTLQLALVGVLFFGCVPALVSLWQLKLDFRRVGSVGLIVGAIALTLIASGFANTESGVLVQVVAALFGLALSLTFASFVVDDEAFVSGMLQVLAVGHAVMLILMIADGNYSYGRLMGRAGPNYWGMVASTTVFASLAIPARWLRFGVMAVAIAALVLCQSRGSAGATVAGLAAVAAVWVLRRPQTRIIYVSAALLVALAGMLLSWENLERLLLLDDANRGLESGSGRAAAWGEGLALFERYPFFGVGYRQSDSLLTTASSTHNAYLTMLAETGLAGLLCYVVYLWGAVSRAFAAAFKDLTLTKVAVAGFLAAYAFMGLLERRAINVGNAYSLLMLLLTTWSLRTTPPPSTGH